MGDKESKKPATNFEGDKLINEISSDVERELGLPGGEIEKIKPLSLWAMEKRLRMAATKAMFSYNYYDYARFMAMYHYVHQIRMEGISVVADLIAKCTGIATDIFEAIVIVVAFSIALQKDDSETPPTRLNVVKWIENKLNRL